MKKTPEQLYEEAEQRAQKALEQARKYKAQINEKKRKHDTRCKIMAGGWLMSHIGLTSEDMAMDPTDRNRFDYATTKKLDEVAYKLKMADTLMEAVGGFVDNDKLRECLRGSDPSVRQLLQNIKYNGKQKPVEQIEAEVNDFEFEEDASSDAIKIPAIFRK